MGGERIIVMPRSTAGLSRRSGTLHLDVTAHREGCTRASRSPPRTARCLHLGRAWSCSSGDVWPGGLKPWAREWSLGHGDSAGYLDEPRGAVSRCGVGMSSVCEPPPSVVITVTLTSACAPGLAIALRLPMGLEASSLRAAGYCCPDRLRATSARSTPRRPHGNQQCAKL